MFEVGGVRCYTWYISIIMLIHLIRVSCVGTLRWKLDRDLGIRSMELKVTSNVGIASEKLAWISS